MTGNNRPRPWVTHREVADALGMTERAVRYNVANGKFPTVQIGGRRRLSRKWLERQLRAIDEVGKRRKAANRGTGPLTDLEPGGIAS